MTREPESIEDQIAAWRIRYALGSPTGGRPLAREMPIKLGGAIPTPEEIASVGGPPEPADPTAITHPPEDRPV